MFRISSSVYCYRAFGEHIRGTFYHVAALSFSRLKKIEDSESTSKTILYSDLITSKPGVCLALLN